MRKDFSILLKAVISVVLVNFILIFSMYIFKTKNNLIDDELGWDFSNYIKLNYNDIGLRNYEDKNQILNSNKKKILFLGNSVVAGAGLDIDNIFTQLLNNGPNHEKFLFLNGGADGYEFYRESKKFLRSFINLGLDTVIWIPSINDFQLQAEIRKTFIETQNAQGLKFNKSPKLIIEGFEIISGKIEKFKEENTDKFLWSQKNNYYTNGLMSLAEKDVKNEVYKEIHKLNEILLKNNIKFHVIYLPSHSFCRYKTWKDDKLFHDMQIYLNELKIKQFNFFDKINCKDSLAYSDYVHLNSYGHEELARLINEEIITEL